MPWPSERPTSGSRLGPSTTSAMIRTMTILAGESKPDMVPPRCVGPSLGRPTQDQPGLDHLFVSERAALGGPASAVSLGLQLREQAVELRYLGAQAGQVHDDPLLRRSRQHDDRLLVR